MEGIEHHALATVGGIFVLSFSEHRDQLSQWRAYTGGGGGFSLGVPGLPLKTAAAAAGYTLGKCCYDHREAQEAAHELLLSFLATFTNEGTVILDEQSICHEFSRAIALMAPLYKHPSFSEEAEWRIFSFLSWQDNRLEFRAVPGEIIPYISFSIENIVAKDSDLHYLIVPGPGQRYNPTAGQGIFHKFLKQNVAIGKSEVPYKVK